MKTIKLLICATLILIASAFTVIKSVNWKVKDDYSVKWDGGVFRGLKAEIMFDEEHPEKSSITAFIDPRTVNTGNGLKNSHVKEALDADKFPIITFASKSIIKTTSGYEATGNLTIKDIIKEVKLPFFFDSQKNSDKFPFVYKETFCGKLTVVSKDFNLTRQGMPNTVIVEITVPVTK